MTGTQIIRRIAVFDGRDALCQTRIIRTPTLASRAHMGIVNIRLCRRILPILTSRVQLGTKRALRLYQTIVLRADVIISRTQTPMRELLNSRQGALLPRRRSDTGRDLRTGLQADTSRGRKPGIEESSARAGHAVSTQAPHPCAMSRGGIQKQRPRTRSGTL